jgi:hypothetical protein
VKKTHRKIDIGSDSIRTDKAPGQQKGEEKGAGA